QLPRHGISPTSGLRADAAGDVCFFGVGGSPFAGPVFHRAARRMRGAGVLRPTRRMAAGAGIGGGDWARYFAHKGNSWSGTFGELELAAFGPCRGLLSIGVLFFCDSCSVESGCAAGQDSGEVAGARGGFSAPASAAGAIVQSLSVGWIS